MSEEVLKVANSAGLWPIAFLIVLVVLSQSIAYVRLCFKVSSKVNYPLDKCKKAIKVGVISAVGPTLAVCVGAIAMMAVLGTPITWMRLSLIGAVSTQLTAATLGAQALGLQFGGEGYDLYALSTSLWTTTINGCGWLVLTALFTHKLEGIRQKAGGGDSHWLAVLSGAAAIGAFGYLNANNINGSLASIRNAATAAAAAVTEAAKAAAANNSAVATGSIYALGGGLIGMFVVSKAAAKYPWLREYTLAIAMLIGMTVGAIYHY